jgi:hypothetical protein
MARSGAFRRNPVKRYRVVKKRRPAAVSRPAPRRRAIRSPYDTGEHRPRVRIIRGSRLERWRPKSPYKGVITRANPRRKKMRRRRSTHVAYRRRRTRRNPSPVMLVNRRRRRSRVRRHASRRTRRNPYMLVNPRRSLRRRRHYRHYRRNPMSMGGVKQILNKDFLMAGALGFAGVFVGIKATKYIAQVPFVGDYPRVHGLVTVVAAGLIAWKGKSVHARSFAMGLLISGIWDLATKNFPTVFALPSAVGVDLMGEEVRMAEIEGTEMQGTEMQGEDYSQSEVVGAGGGYNSGY